MDYNKVQLSSSTFNEKAKKKSVTFCHNIAQRKCCALFSHDDGTYLWSQKLLYKDCGFIEISFDLIVKKFKKEIWLNIEWKLINLIA